MNLLRDPWILVRQQDGRRRATLKEVLCADAPFELAARRDDLEIATLQLMVAIAQTVLPAATAKDLRDRERYPLSESEYDTATVEYLSWFDLRHEETPFMQYRGVTAAGETPIQKLFIGLPEGNNHAFFNDPGEVSIACEACVAIALMNQASNCPSFGGGFKGSLRGGAPITTLVQGPTLRATLWRNVLAREGIDALYASREDKPTWVRTLSQGEKISAADVGLSRGLLWQPLRVEMIWEESTCRCEACGLDSSFVARAFLTQKFTYDFVGSWRHPHGPRRWQTKKGTTDVWYDSFTTQAPAWTHLTGFVLSAKNDAKGEGHEPAPVVEQFANLFASAVAKHGMTLLVGGYRNKQAAVLERRHELISLSAGWHQNAEAVKNLVNLAIGVKNALRAKIFGFAKEVGVPGLERRAEEAFYRDSEGLIYRILGEADWAQADRLFVTLGNELVELAWSTFETITGPYSHSPKMIRALAVARRNLNWELNKLVPTGETE